MNATRTLLVLLQDRPGVLHRAVTLLRRHSLNITSLYVCKSEVPGISRMTIEVDASDTRLVVRQLERLVEIVQVTDITPAPFGFVPGYRAQADGVTTDSMSSEEAA